MVVFTIFPLLVSSDFVTIVESSFPKRVILHSVVVHHGVTADGGFSMTETMISPKESARPTIAGTNASPINSLRSKELLLSLNIPSHRTNLRVMNGENIA